LHQESFAKVDLHTPITLRGTTFFHGKGESPEEIIATMEEVHGRTDFYPLVSGGKDSVSMTHWLAEHNKLKSVIHIDTGV